MYFVLYILLFLLSLLDGVITGHVHDTFCIWSLEALVVFKDNPNLTKSICFSSEIIWSKLSLTSLIERQPSYFISGDWTNGYQFWMKSPRRGLEALWVHLPSQEPHKSLCLHRWNIIFSVSVKTSNCGKNNSLLVVYVFCLQLNEDTIQVSFTLMSRMVLNFNIYLFICLLSFLLLVLDFIFEFMVVAFLLRFSDPPQYFSDFPLLKWCARLK